MRQLSPLFRLLPLALLSACTPAHALTQQTVDYGGHRYRVVTLDLTRERLALYWKDAAGQPYGTAARLTQALKAQGLRVLMTTNSGIYAPGLRPLGLHVQGGKTLVGLNHARRGGNFALLPNGVFWVKGQQAGVSESLSYERGGARPDYATQSGPLLVSGGRLHPEFNAGSTSFKLRSGVGVCGGVVKFAVSEDAVNFSSFARLFRDRLGCPDALYLDGSISTLSTPEHPDTQLVEYAGIWAVTAR